MVEIIFEAHSTSLDNEAGKASGCFDVELSKLGEKQARELGERYKSQYLDVIFCSDLKRSYKTADIAFANYRFSIIRDPRIRECDYGDYTRRSSKEVDEVKEKFIDVAFPNGESFKDTNRRMKSFLTDLLDRYNSKRVMIIGHRATQYALECFVNGLSLKEAITASWKWQPGWVYCLEESHIK